MEIILKEDIENLGNKDELVTVKNGYGLNYLIPQGKAILATPGNKKQLEETIRQRAHKEAKLKEEAEKLAEKVKGMTIKIGAKAGENGRIFGSVNSIQLADAMKKDGLDIDRKKITLDQDAIKTLGKYTATIQLHKEVAVELDFEVIED